MDVTQWNDELGVYKLMNALEMDSSPAPIALVFQYNLKCRQGLDDTVEEHVRQKFTVLIALFQTLDGNGELSSSARFVWQGQLLKSQQAMFTGSRKDARTFLGAVRGFYEKNGGQVTSGLESLKLARVTEEPQPPIKPFAPSSGPRKLAA